MLSVDVRHEEMMNPYAPYLFCIPSVIAVIAVFPRKRIARWSLLAAAAGIYWCILPRFVTWAYAHPFDPNDGGPKAFSAVFGWLIGLITLILPIYLSAISVRWVISRTKERRRLTTT
jgi:hypothetical protein